MRLPVNPALPLAALAMLSGCIGSGGDAPSDAIPVSSQGPSADYPMTIGDPFTIDGTTYAPSDKLNYDEVGYAVAGTDAGPGISAAHKTLPVPSYVEVTSLASGRTILVRVERRGPMRNDRLVELSPGALAQLGLTADNAPVRVRRVNPPEAERALLRSGQVAQTRMETPRPLLNVLMRKLDPKFVAPAAGVAAAPALPMQGRDKPRPGAQAPAPMATARPVPAPVRTSVRVTPLKPADPAPADSTPTRPAPPSPAAGRPAPPLPVPPRPAAVSGGLIIQAGAFSNRANADSVAKAIDGHVESSGRLFRVRSGPFATRAQAEAALAKARSAGYRDARIQRVD